MLLNIGFLFFAASLCHAKAVLPRPKNVTGPGFISLPVIAVNNTDGQIRKRQSNTDLFNTDFGTVYLVHLSLGTPAQPVYLLLDTGSSETWVDPDCTTASTTHQQSECNSFPKYDPFTSSTALDAGYPFELAYGKGTASGEYLLDTVHVAGATITNLQFGWADTTTSMFAGILATSYGYELAGYYCLLDEMYVQGIINSRAFSLDLGNVDSAAGSILFGGIDTKKFTGSLEKCPIIAPGSSPDGYLRYWIYMTSVGITKPGATTSKRYTVAPPAYQQAVFLDSGGTLSQLPANLVAAMLADFTGVIDNGNGLYTVDCAQTTQAGTFDFGFGNTIIRVPFHEFIWVPAPGVCVFGAVAVDTSVSVSWVLGDTFLRSCYTVFDQDNDNLLLAQYVDCGTNIIPIGSGVNAVPSVTGACKPTSTIASSTSKSSTSSVRSTSSLKSSTSVKPTSSIPSSKSSTSTTLRSTSSSSSRSVPISSSVKPTVSTTFKITSTLSSVKTSSSSKLSSLSSVKTSSSTSSKGPSSSSSVKPSSSSSRVSTTNSLKTSSSSTKPFTSTLTKSTSTSKPTSNLSSTKLASSSSSKSTVTSKPSSSLSSTKSLSSSKLPSSTSSVKPTSASKSSTSFRTTTSSQKSSSTISAQVVTRTLGYEYAGCFKESNPKSMTKILANDTMSVEICLSVAKAHVPPYPYAGLEFARECWAALTTPTAATPTSGVGACTKTCIGNPTQTCGGAAMFNLYYSATATP
ncbi:acid protease [Cadophora sp. DSE1049]|nr:acid protease [Cadophora sp. DSE1049]